MKYPVYCYRDKSAGFGSPEVNLNDACEIRKFAYDISGNNGMMNFKPDDFDLYKIAEFDTEKGVITPVSPIEFVISGRNAMEK